MSKIDFDAIRANNPIAGVIGQHVQLTSNGKEFKGCCPFHNERSPSFTVVPDKEFYHCFGCGAHGDVIDFVENFKGCDTAEAIAILTDGKEIEQTPEAKAQREATNLERRLEQAALRVQATEAAQEIWEAADTANPNHEYLKRKNVDGFGLKERKGALMLPIRSPSGEIQSIQTIEPDGKKMFIQYAPTTNGCMYIGFPSGRTIIAEGYATGATIHDILLDRVCIAYSGNNMASMARLLHSEGEKIVLAADTGESAKKMRELGDELGVPVVVPREDIPDGGSDFNDQAKHFGGQSIRDSFKESLQQHAELNDPEMYNRIDGEGPDPFNFWEPHTPPPLPLGVMPKIIEEYAVNMGRQLGSDPAGFAMTAITACAAMIPDSIRAKPKLHEEWTESARLWTMLVGNPSTRKTPMVSRTTARIKELDRQMMYENQRAMQDWAEDKKDGVDNPKPAQPRLRIEDTTPEAAQEVAKDSPEGVLMLQDELSGFFAKMDKVGGGDGRAFWLQSYNGGAYTVNRIARGAIMIDNLSFTMIGGIQPDAIKRILKESADDGLMQRFIPVVLRRAERDRDVESPPVEQGLGDLLEALRGRKPIENFFGVKPYLFSPEARKVREEMADQHQDLSEVYHDVSRRMATHYGKSDGIFIRLCLIWHVIENHETAEISGETAERVATFMREFLRPNVEAFYLGIVEHAEEETLAKDIAGYLLAKQPETFTSGQLRRDVRSCRAADEESRQAAIDVIVQFEWARPEDPKAYRPSKWMMNVDEVRAKFGHIANQERERRKRLHETIKSHGKKRGGTKPPEDQS